MEYIQTLIMGTNYNPVYNPQIQLIPYPNSHRLNHINFNCNLKYNVIQCLTFGEHII